MCLVKVVSVVDQQVAIESHAYSGKWIVSFRGNVNKFYDFFDQIDYLPLLFSYPGSINQTDKYLDKKGGFP